MKTGSCRASLKFSAVIFGLVAWASTVLVGCNATVLPPDTTALDRVCPRGSGGQPTECCDANGNLLTQNVPRTCNNDLDGGVLSSLVSGFTAIQIANDQLDVADAMLAANGLSASTGISAPGAGSGAYGSGGSGGSGGAPLGSGVNVTPAPAPASGGILQQATQLAAQFFGGAAGNSAPTVSSASPEARRSAGSGSALNATNALTATGSATAQSLLNRIQSQSSGAYANGETSGGGGSRGSSNSNSNDDSYGSNALVSGGGTTELPLNLTGGRTPASANSRSSLSTMRSVDPEDYFSRISPEESLFVRVNAQYRREENGLTLPSVPTAPRAPASGARAVNVRRSGFRSNDKSAR